MIIKETYINIYKDIAKIDNIIVKNTNNIVMIIPDFLILNPDNSKHAEKIIIYDNNNVIFEVICFEDNKIKNNKFKKLLDLDELYYNKKVEILKDVILEKLKRKYINEFSKLKDITIYIGIILKENNILNIIINYN